MFTRASSYENARSVSRPCWPIVWVFVASISQYAYRYILQVNDPSTSSQYEATPAALSGIKYGILLLFVAFSLARFLRRPVLISRNYRALLYVSAFALLALSSALFFRFAFLPGALDETGVCALQLVPWMICVFLIPLVFESKHDISDTLEMFERIVFWISFPFWLITVVLVIADIRYPALSYPGALIRFGGILDDPNGYACLCLLLLALSASIQRGAWKLRATAYVVMLIGTLSITGYITGAVMLLCLLPYWIKKTKPITICLVTAAIVCVMIVPLRLYAENQAIVDGISLLYSGKSTSAATHISALSPDEDMLDVSLPLTTLVGIGGFSENFYWRVLVNFGWVGLFGVAVTIGLWTYYALRSSRWRSSVGAWSVGLLVGSNGIAYLLTFPLNLIYWCVIAMILRAKENQWART